MESINVFFSTTHGTLIFCALGLLFVTTTFLSLSGVVRNGMKGKGSKKYGVISSFFLILFGLKYTSSYSAYFWIAIIVIVISYLLGFPNL